MSVGQSRLLSPAKSCHGGTQGRLRTGRISVDVDTATWKGSQLPVSLALWLAAVESANPKPNIDAAGFCWARRILEVDVARTPPHHSPCVIITVTVTVTSVRLLNDLPPQPPCPVPRAPSCYYCAGQGAGAGSASLQPVCRYRSILFSVIHSYRHNGGASLVVLGLSSVDHPRRVHPADACTRCEGTFGDRFPSSVLAPSPTLILTLTLRLCREAYSPFLPVRVRSSRARAASRVGVGGGGLGSAVPRQYCMDCIAPWSVAACGRPRFLCSRCFAGDRQQGAYTCAIH